MAAHGSMLRAGASDSEDDLATAGANGTRKASRPKATSKPTTTKTATKRKAATGKSRQPLKDQTNVQTEAEEMDEDEGAKPKAKRARVAARKPKAKAADALRAIPETVPDVDQTEEVEQSIEEDLAAGADHVPTPKQVQRFVQRPRSASTQPLQPRASARPASAQPIYPPPRERSGSVSGTERERRGGDPELRRKLSEMAKKYESISLKYQDLQEISKTSAESNFEKLKRASDQKAKDANDLIASLKKETAELRKSFDSNNSEQQALQKQVSTLTTVNSSVTTERDALKEKLQTAQNEVRSLEAKLSAARQQVANMQETSKVTASATKNLGRNVTANATDAQKEAKMKENLYSDLTGLIIRGVKRKEGEDEFDCIQTGRNGTLHFHLSVANDASISNPKTPTGLSYEEAEFSYEPFLDESRDRELFDILPDYLVEDICFPRNHALKFYSKLLESMTKKIVVEDQE